MACVCNSFSLGFYLQSALFVMGLWLLFLMHSYYTYQFKQFLRLCCCIGAAVQCLYRSILQKLFIAFMLWVEFIRRRRPFCCCCVHLLHCLLPAGDMYVYAHDVCVSKSRKTKNNICFRTIIMYVFFTIIDYRAIIIIIVVLGYLNYWTVVLRQ